jgi:hypothetical protein
MKSPDVCQLSEVVRADRGGFDGEDLREHVQEAASRYLGTGLDVSWSTRARSNIVLVDSPASR